MGDPAQIDVEHVVPVSHLVTGHVTTYTDACVVEEIVDAACAGYRFVDDALKLGGVTDIELMGGGSSASAPNRAGDLFGERELPVDEDYLDTSFRQLFGQRPTDSRCATSDESCLGRHGLPFGVFVEEEDR
jgi:hypothetical protein